MTEEETKRAFRDILRRMLESSGGTIRYGCGTPLIKSLNSAVRDFREGRPVCKGITVDEVVMTVYDEWRIAGRKCCDSVETDIYAPMFSINDGKKSELMIDEADIEGFKPVHEHEYTLRVRRIFITNNPFYHHYELLELINDAFSKR